MIRKIHLLFFLVTSLILISLGSGNLVAQEVYFAEDPPIVLKQGTNRFTNYVVEYSAKNNGTIELELWHQSKLIAKGIHQVKKRGSNTAHLDLIMLDTNQTLLVADGYRYELALFEEEFKPIEKRTRTSQSNYSSFNTSLQAVDHKPKVKQHRVSHTVLNGISVTQ